MTFNAQLEKRKRKELLIQKQKTVGLSKELTDVDSLYNPPTDPIQFNSFVVATDSGAHSLYKEHFVIGDKITAQARVKADYSYIKTDEFKQFLDRYIEHLHQYKHLYQFYVSLDIINNPEESWRITEYMESCGLNPMPVFHNGEDIHWLERMVEKYDYIGISGLGQDLVKAKFKPYGDSCFKVICDKHGKPKCKVHGFAMGAPEIIKMYPWYSADQSTWTYMSRVGSLLVPKPLHKGKDLLGYDFLNMYKVIPVTNRRDVESMHVNNLSDLTLHFVKEYLRLNDIDLDAVRESYHWRDVANIRLFNNIQSAAKTWYKEQFDYGEGGNIYFAGTAAGAGSNKSRLIKLLHDVKISTINWLTTPVYQLHANNIRELAEAWIEKLDWRSLWNPEQASKARKNSWGVIKEVQAPEVKPKVERKPLKRLTGPIELNVNVTLKESKVVDASYYPNLTLQQAVDQQAKDVQQWFSKVAGEEYDVSVVLSMKHEGTTVEATVATSEQPEDSQPQAKVSSYGFF